MSNLFAQFTLIEPPMNPRRSWLKIPDIEQFYQVQSETHGTYTMVVSPPESINVMFARVRETPAQVQALVDAWNEGLRAMGWGHLAVHPKCVVSEVRELNLQPPSYIHSPEMATNSQRVLSESSNTEPRAGQV